MAIMDHGLELKTMIDNNDFDRAWQFAYDNGLIRAMIQYQGMQLLGVNTFNESRMIEFYLAGGRHYNQARADGMPAAPLVWANNSQGRQTNRAIQNANDPDLSQYPHFAYFNGEMPEPSALIEYGGLLIRTVVIGGITAGLGAVIGNAATTAATSAVASSTGVAATSVTLSATTTTAISVGSNALAGAAIGVAQGQDFGDALQSGLVGGIVGSALQGTGITGAISDGSDAIFGPGQVADYAASVTIGTTSGAILNGGDFDAAFTGAVTGSTLNYLGSNIIDAAQRAPAQENIVSGQNSAAGGVNFNSAEQSTYQTSDDLFGTNINYDVAFQDSNGYQPGELNTSQTLGLGSNVNSNTYDPFQSIQQVINNSNNIVRQVDVTNYIAGLTGGGAVIGVAGTNSGANSLSSAESRVNQLNNSFDRDSDIRMFTPDGQVDMNLQRNSHYHVLLNQGTTQADDFLALGEGFSNSTGRGNGGHSILAEFLGDADAVHRPTDGQNYTGNLVIDSDGNAHVGGWFHSGPHDEAAQSLSNYLSDRGFNVVETTGGRIERPVTNSPYVGNQGGFINLEAFGITPRNISSTLDSISDLTRAGGVAGLITGGLGLVRDGANAVNSDLQTFAYNNETRQIENGSSPNTMVADSFVQASAGVVDFVADTLNQQTVSGAIDTTYALGEAVYSPWTALGTAAGSYIGMQTATDPEVAALAQERMNNATDVISDSISNFSNTLGQTVWSLGDTLSNPVTDAIGTSIGRGIASLESFFSSQQQSCTAGNSGCQSSGDTSDSGQ